jgi:DNA-binding transcriptional regulator YiaG
MGHRLPSVIIFYTALSGYYYLFFPVYFMFLIIARFSLLRVAFSPLTPYTKSCKMGIVNKQHKPDKKSWDSARIQAFRQHLGLTQRELAERLGTRQQTISEWETGMYQPRGASATLLSIIAEQSRFKYDAGPPKK